MIISFFESIKYAGHFWPVALLRICVGGLFLKAGLDKVHNDFLRSPILVEILNRWQAADHSHPGYAHFVQTWIIPHWQIVSHLVTFGEILVGVSFVLGFAVRPAALAAVFINANILLAGGSEVLVLNKLLIYVNMVFFLTSAGRCIGFDFYFYKRVRGLWW